MEVSSDDVVLLVGAEERLAVVDEVADERGRQEREVGEEDDAHLELGGREDERQAGPEHQAGAEDDEPDPAVEVAEDGDDLVDLRLVVVVVNPTKSAPSVSRKIFREKNDSVSVRK